MAREGKISQSFFLGRESKNSSLYAKVNRFLEVTCACQAHLSGKDLSPLAPSRPLLNSRNGPNSVIHCDRLRLREMWASIP